MSRLRLLPTRRRPRLDRLPRPTPLRVRPDPPQPPLVQVVHDLLILMRENPTQAQATCELIHGLAALEESRPARRAGDR